VYVIANGGLKEYGTNTIESIMLAKNASFTDGVLIDVRLTFDNKLVSCKYDDLSKTTLSKGLVSKMKYCDLKKVKLLNKTYKNYIPLLKEILDKYQSNKIIILNLHDAIDKNEVLVNEVIKLIDNYPDYNFYLETSSKEVLQELIVKNICIINKNYRIGLRFTTNAYWCNNKTLFCDTLCNETNDSINFYNQVLVHNLNKKHDLVSFMKYLDKDKINDLIIISDNPKEIKKCLKNDFLFDVKL